MTMTECCLFVCLFVYYYYYYYFLFILDVVRKVVHLMIMWC